MTIRAWIEFLFNLNRTTLSAFLTMTSSFREYRRCLLVSNFYHDLRVNHEALHHSRKAPGTELLETSQRNGIQFAMKKFPSSILSNHFEQGHS